MDPRPGGRASSMRTARCRGWWARTSTSPTRSATKRWWPARRMCTSSWPTGAPLEQSLDSLLRVVEAQSSGMLGSILLLDADGTHVHHLAAPSLPLEFCRAIDGEAIGEGAGSCGTAMYRREPVIVEDIASDPLWSDYREIALRHGLRAAWSTPIFDADEQGPRIVRAVLHRTAAPIRISPATDCDGDALRGDRDHQTSRAACADRGRRAVAPGHCRREPRHLASRHVHAATRTARMHASHFAGLRRGRRSRPHDCSKCCIPLTEMLRTPLCAAR